MTDEGSSKRVPVLDPVDRVSEVVFGILMALTFTGTLSVATDAREHVRTMLHTALGCNLAWGLTDAVMYLTRALTERRRKVRLLHRIQATIDPKDAHRLILDELPPFFAANSEGAMLEALNQRLRVLPVPSARLGSRDYFAALGVFALVVLATFPVVVPFIFISETALALRVSNLLAIGTLFICGTALGHYTTERAWMYGFAMTGLGVALVTIIVALGG